jgi:hypothetical protein
VEVLDVFRSAAWQNSLALLACILISAISSAGPPKVGDPAPLFRLPSLGSETEVDLHDIVGNKPIVLFFGSYT